MFKQEEAPEVKAELPKQKREKRALKMKYSPESLNEYLKRLKLDGAISSLSSALDCPSTSIL